MRDGGGRIVAAVSVAGNTDHIDSDRFAALAKDVKATATSISQQLGEFDEAAGLLLTGTSG